MKLSSQVTAAGALCITVSDGALQNALYFELAEKENIVSFITEAFDAAQKYIEENPDFVKSETESEE